MNRYWMISDDERSDATRMAGSISDAEAQLWKLGAACVLGMSVKECAAVDELLAKCQGVEMPADDERAS